jgi:hypothetical protein
VIVVAIVGLAPTCRAIALHGSWPALGVAAAAAVTAVALVRTPPSRLLAPIGMVAVVMATIVASIIAGLTTGAWLLLGAVGALGVVHAWRSRPDDPATRGIGPVLGATVGAAVIAALHPRSPIASVVAVLAASLGLASGRWPDRFASFDDRARRLAHRVGDGVAIAGFAILAIPFVVLPWAVGRIVRWDATWSPTRPSSTWSPTTDGAAPTSRTWLPAPPVRTWPWQRRIGRAVVRVAAVVVVVALGLSAVRSRASEPPAYLLDAPAMADASYWPELIRAQEQLRANMQLSSYAYEQPDVSSPHLNIRGGHRVTWSPPERTTCRPAEVWVFGGSTTFGEGQRDEHTIPSALARAAWADGHAIDVTNFGQLGDPLWIEVRRLAEALGTRSERPDLVIFYDGANEVITRIALNDQGRAGEHTFVSYLDSGLFIQLDRFLRPVYQFSTEDGGLEVERPPTGRLGADEVARLAHQQYELALEDARGLVAAEGLDAVWFNQPTRWTSLDGDPMALSDADRFGRAVTDRYLAALPAGVIDLSDLFVGDEASVFYDTAHTNELGARRVAEAMWSEVSGRLTSSCSTEPTCC